MSTPLVCAIMLTRDREEMARRAVECWRKQTYERKILFVMDTGQSCGFGAGIPISDRDGIYCDHYPHIPGWTIGKLRNTCGVAAQNLKADIICHWDDDDVSHSNRIAEQVALLQSSGADAVGYNQALFWNVRQLSQKDVYGEGTDEPWDVAEEAWLYTAQPGAQALGASLCYWRSTWERQPFEDKMFGEDLHFQLGLNVETVSGLADGTFFCNKCGYSGNSSLHPRCEYYAYGIKSPRLICTVHGGNTSTKINPAKREWKRAEDWDEYCRSTMNHA